MVTAIRGDAGSRNTLRVHRSLEDFSVRTFILNDVRTVILKHGPFDRANYRGMSTRGCDVGGWPGISARREKRRPEPVGGWIRVPQCRLEAFCRSERWPTAAAGEPDEGASERKGCVS
jgi:hypothetical protein